MAKAKMVVGDANINNIMGGMENAVIMKQHNHKKKLKQRFDIIKKLGQGTFGKVQLGINKETGQEVAIKTIKKSKIESEADLTRIRREIQIMSSVQHPNIIHIYEVFENREKMVLVMEYAAGGELYDYLSERKVLQENEARRIFRQIATACYYCHKHKICHRDLKLENILLDENNNAKIADFGLSNVFDDQRLLDTYCGSPLYASPEIVKGTPYNGPEVDCWSLGVLLYTLVYGAMPFDGSNFKSLVKQISHGDYFEPTKPSPASPLIHDMLTCNPKLRANIEKICTHWWVNEGYNDNCLDISEELANQTPVRLDLLLSLAPPVPQLESEKLLVTDDVVNQQQQQQQQEGNKTDDQPLRSQSVDSLMELGRRINEFKQQQQQQQIQPTSKRKLENTISQDGGINLKRKDKIIKENTIADITLHNNQQQNEQEMLPLDKSLTQTLSSKDKMNVDDEDIINNDDADDNDEEITQIQGAACTELLEEEAKKINELKNKNKIKRTISMNNKTLEGINEIPSQENLLLDKENINNKKKIEEKLDDKTTTPTTTTTKKKIIKKKVLTDKNDNTNNKSKIQQQKSCCEDEEETKKIEQTKDKKLIAKDDTTIIDKSSNEKTTIPTTTTTTTAPPATTTTTTTATPERRRSRIFEAAEKFQNLSNEQQTNNDKKSTTTTTPSNGNDKTKKIVIPGVSVDGFKKEFERKASLTSTQQPKLKTTPPTKKTIEVKTNDEPIVSERKELVKNAVNIITNVLSDKDSQTRKSKSRPCCIRKPPVPFGVSGRSASGNISLITNNTTPSVVTNQQQLGPKPYIRQITEPIKCLNDETINEEENKTSSAEITLKSATLPRRKTTKAQIQLNYPVPNKEQQQKMGFKTEMAHPIQAPPPPPPKVQTQRSEVVVPVSGVPIVQFRATSLEPDTNKKERIIPISFEKNKSNNNNDDEPSSPTKPPVSRLQQQQQKTTTTTQKSSDSNLSRQSTQESDSETTISGGGEPIRKSPREYIIPIAVEGGGYVTPRAGSLEPSDTTSTVGTNKSRTKFGRAKRMSSLLSDRDSEDESPFPHLYRRNNSSFGKDSDTEDSKRGDFHMHRLRSTRPKKTNLEHADSVSSGEEDDDDGFEILTAENLFSTLLSRVRDLTQRLNVEDGGRPGFPKSRLLSHFDHGTNFWNLHNRLDPLSRHSSLSRGFSRDRSSTNSIPTSASTNAPWRRSISRDLTSDIESVFNDGNQQTTTTTPRPRGDKKSTTTTTTSNNLLLDEEENLNLADLDLKKIKLSDEDALALSYLTPGLSKRIQKQLFSKLPASEVKKLQRTLSSTSTTTSHNNNNNNNKNYYEDENKFLRRSLDRLGNNEPLTTTSSYNRSNLPTIIKPTTTTTIPSTSHYHLSDYDHLRNKSTSLPIRSLSLREPKLSAGTTTTATTLYSPDSSLSDSLSKSESLSRPSSSSLIKYSFNDTNKYLLNNNKTDLTKKPSIINSNTTTTTSPRRISRFLRPDFYDTTTTTTKNDNNNNNNTNNNTENIIVKEKKEREMETQKVLKEIRDKRKGRLRSRERLSSNNTATTTTTTNNNNNIVHDYVNMPGNIICGGGGERFVNLDEIDNKKIMPDYVNVKKSDNNNLLLTTTPSSNTVVKGNQQEVDKKENSTIPTTSVIKKERTLTSKIARPKSYPSENNNNNDNNNKTKIPAIESKINKLKKGFINCYQSNLPTNTNRSGNNKEIIEKEKENIIKEKSPPQQQQNYHKNKLLQSIEKKLEKFRSNQTKDNNTVLPPPPNTTTTIASPSTSTNSDETKIIKSNIGSSSSSGGGGGGGGGIDNVIKRLREQSLPRNLENICTESSLIKRAVSVEDLSSKSASYKPLQTSRKSVTKILNLFKKYEEQGQEHDDRLTLKKNKTKINKSSKMSSPCDDDDDNDNTMSLLDKNNGQQQQRRPRSVLLERMKNFQQNVYNGAKNKSDSLITNNSNEKESKLVNNNKSKLPIVNRRSLNLDLPVIETTNNEISMAAAINNQERDLVNEKEEEEEEERGNDLIINNSNQQQQEKVDRSNLKLDLKTINNNLMLLSPNTTAISGFDDNISDSMSVCSINDLHSPTSSINYTNNNHNLLCSGDEGESVSERIRRKSFYTRFNEMKRPTIQQQQQQRNKLLRNYKDLDLYSTNNKTTPQQFDYGSLDRRNYHPHHYHQRSTIPINNINNNNNNRNYNLINDYVNVPSSNRYQTYNNSLKMSNRPSTSHSIYSNSEDNVLDDLLLSTTLSSAAKSRKYSSQLQQPSRFNKNNNNNNRKSTSPINEQYFIKRPSSSSVLLNNNINSPTSSEPI